MEKFGGEEEEEDSITSGIYAGLSQPATSSGDFNSPSFQLLFFCPPIFCPPLSSPQPKILVSTIQTRDIKPVKRKKLAKKKGKRASEIEIVGLKRLFKRRKIGRMEG